MTYRWERRRNRKYKSCSRSRLEALDYVLLITTFLIWFLTLRVIFIFQATTVPCVEAWFTAGQTPNTPSIFSGLKSISYALLALWGTISFSRWIERKTKPISYIWQSILGLPIILLIFAAYMLTPSQSLNPPDGMMRVHHNLVANIDGQDIYTPNLYEYDVFGEWRRGASGDSGVPSKNYNPYSCVWLDENKVTHINLVRDNDLGAMDYKYLNHAPFKAVDILHTRQQYRPLTAAERDRFMAQQDCMNELSHYGKHRRHCEYHWHIDGESNNENPTEPLEEVIR